MSQLLTLIWLKWKLLRNSLRSTKAIANQLASALGTLITLILAAGVALGLGVTAYLITHSTEMAAVMQKTMAQQSRSSASAELIFFSIFSFLYLMWATLPLSVGGSKQFDAGRLLMYPISLRKLFAVDFISELTTLQSLFAVPAIIARFRESHRLSPCSDTNNCFRGSPLKMVGNHDRLIGKEKES